VSQGLTGNAVQSAPVAAAAVRAGGGGGGRPHERSAFGLTLRSTGRCVARSCGLNTAVMIITTMSEVLLSRTIYPMK